MSFISKQDTQKGATVQRSEQETDVLEFQKQEGNDHPNPAVDLNRKIINGDPVQAKLTMGSPGDKFELEADETADKVMSKPLERGAFSGGVDDEKPDISKKGLLQSGEEEKVAEKQEEETVSTVKENDISKKEFLQTVLYDEQKDTRNDMVNAKEEQSDVSPVKEDLVSAKEEDLQAINTEEVSRKESDELSKKSFIQTVLYDEDRDIKNDMVNAKEEVNVSGISADNQLNAKVEFPKIPGVGEVMKPGVEEGSSKGEKGKNGEQKQAEGGEKKTEGDKKGLIDVQKPSKPQKSKLKPPKVQKKDEVVESSGELDSAFESRLKNTKGGGKPLPKKIREEMEKRFGRSFKNIRIHTGGEAIRLCHEIGARAFTNGHHIYFNSGQFEPESMEGKRLLAHELTHTIQQGASGLTKVQREPFNPDGASPTGKGKPEMINDGKEVNNEGDSYMKSSDNYDEDNVDKPVSEMDDDEKKQMHTTSGESKEEQKDVEEKGVNKTKKDRGGDAIKEVEKEKEKIESQEVEEEEKTENSEEGEGEKEEKSEAELAAERSKVALERAEELKDPKTFPEFKEPRIEKPHDADGKELPGDPELDHIVRGLAYLGKAFREHAFELLKYSIAQNKKAYSLDAVIERQREDLAHSEEVVTNADQYSLDYKEASESGKTAENESVVRQGFTEQEAPKLKAISDGAQSDSKSMVSDTEKQSKENSKNLPTDDDARKDAEEQGGEMDNMAVGALTIWDAFLFASLSMDTYIKDAEFAKEKNVEGQTQIEETDATIEQYDIRNEELKAGNEQTTEELAAVEFGPEEMRTRAASVQDGGYELYAATVVMELELIDIQEKYLKDMSKVKSKETLEKEEKERQKNGEQGENEGLNFTQDQLDVISMGGMNEEEQQEFIENNPGKEQDYMFALDSLEPFIGEEEDKSHDFTPQDTSFKNELLGRNRERVDLGGNKLMGMEHEQDPRAAEYQPIEEQRKKRLGKPLDIADKNMTILSYQEKDMIAGNLVTDSLVYDVGNMFTWENAGNMAGEMAKGMFDPRVSMAGVFGGFEKIGSGIVNFSEHWKEDPLGAVLKSGADIATGIATVAASVLGVCMAIQGIMLAITIAGWMFPFPITIPSMTWMGTVMTISGYTALIAGALSFRLNQLMYQHNLHKAASATTAREFLGFSLDMKENVTDGATGLMSMTAGIGGAKMGPNFNMKNVVSNFATPKAAFNTLKKGIKGTAKFTGKVLKATAAGLSKMVKGGMKFLKSLRTKIKNFFAKLKKKVGGRNEPHSIKHAPDGGDLGSFQGQKVKSEVDFPDGHEGKVLNDGQCAICSNCKKIREHFGEELKNNPEIDAKLKRLEDRLKKNPGDTDAVTQQKNMFDELEMKSVDDRIQSFEDRIASGDRSISKAEYQEYSSLKRARESQKELHNQLIDEQSRRIGPETKKAEQKLSGDAENNIPPDRTMTQEEYIKYDRDRRMLEGNTDRVKKRYDERVKNGSYDRERVKKELQEGKSFNEQTGRFGNTSGVSKRIEYLGSTPGKTSATGKAVIRRMSKQKPPAGGRIRFDREGNPTHAYGKIGKSGSTEGWFPIEDADMGHLHDAVKYWNETGRKFGPKSEEVRTWMKNPNNYELQHYSYNRSQGASINETYLPPL